VITRRVSVLLIGLLVAVAGCAAPARSEKMVAEVATPAPATLRERVAVTDVTSSKNSEVASDKLRQAVEMSSQKAGYLNANPAAAPVLLEGDARHDRRIIHRKCQGADTPWAVLARHRGPARAEGEVSAT